MKTVDGITYYETLEELGAALYKMGLIEFVDGRYQISEKGKIIVKVRPVVEKKR
jgi:predicted transcriptional regulator